MNISIMGKDITFCITITPIKLMEKHTQAMCQVQLNYIVVFIKKNLKSRMNTTLIGLLLYFLILLYIGFPQHSFTSSTQASNNETSAETSLKAHSLVNHCVNNFGH